MGINPNQPVMAPVLNPSLARDLAAQRAAEEQYALDYDTVQKLKALLATAQNPMMMIQMIMLDIMNLSGDKIAGLSAVDNVETDLRNQFNNGQSNFNGVGGSQPNSPTAPGQATNMANGIDGIASFLQWQQGLPANDPQKVISDSDSSSLLSAIGSIRSSFGYTSPTSQGDWGNGTAMAADIQKWVAQGGTGGTYAPQLNAIQNGFQTDNSAVSALSTATNSDLQFNGKQFEQFMGIAQSVGQAMLKLYLAMINNSKSN